MNKKIIYLVLSFLLLIPFRLPIAVLFINLITDIANLTGDLSSKILLANVIVTKVIYNLAIAATTVFNVEMLSRKILNRKAKEIGDTEAELFWWGIPIIFLLVAYMIFDGINTAELFNLLNT